MLDPLTLTTACASVLSSITSLSKSFTRFVSEVREARKDVEAVRREIASLSSCVENLQADILDNQIQYPAHLQNGLRQVLDESDHVVGDIAALVERILASGAGSRMFWALSGQSDMEKLRSRLEAHKATLNLSLDLINNVKESTDAIATQNVAIKEDTGMIRDNTGHIQLQVVDLIAEIQSLKFKLERPGDREEELGGRQHILKRFLDESTDYAQTVMGDDRATEPDLTRSYRNSLLPDELSARPPRTRVTSLEQAMLGADRRGKEASLHAPSSSTSVGGSGDASLTAVTESTMPSKFSALSVDPVHSARLAREALSLSSQIDLDTKFGNHFCEMPKDADRDAWVLQLKQFLRAGADVNHRHVNGEWVCNGYWTYWLPKETMIDDLSRKTVRFQTPLIASIILFPGSLELVDLLLSYGANVNARRETDWESNDQYIEFEYALHAAAAVKNRHTVQLLLDRGADPNAQGGLFGTALTVASFLGEVDVAILLLDRGAKVDLPSEPLGTPLIMSAQSYHPSMVKLLVGRGAEVDFAGGLCDCASFAAIRKPYHKNAERITRSLLDHRANVNVCARDGVTTPILQVFQTIVKHKEDSDLFGLLIRYGADVNTVIPGKGTMIHLSMCREIQFVRKSLCQPLIEAGASLFIKADTKRHGPCTTMEWIVSYSTSPVQYLELLRDWDFRFANSKEYRTALKQAEDRYPSSSPSLRELKMTLRWIHDKGMRDSTTTELSLKSPTSISRFFKLGK